MLIILGSICSIIYINRYLEFKEQLSKQTIQIHSHLWINGKKVDCNDYMKQCSITCEEDNYRTGDCYYDEFGVTSIIYLTVIAIIILLLDCSKFSMKTYRYRYLVIKDESETSSTGNQGDVDIDMQSSQSRPRFSGSENAFFLYSSNGQHELNVKCQGRSSTIKILFRVTSDWS